MTNGDVSEDVSPWQNNLQIWAASIVSRQLDRLTCHLSSDDQRRLVQRIHHAVVPADLFTSLYFLTSQKVPVIVTEGSGLVTHWTSFP
jgi:hypothetical protein